MPEFEDLLDRFTLWLGQRTDSARAIDTYRKHTRQLHRWVSESGLDVEVIDLDHVALRKFFEHEKERGLASTTRRTLRAALVAFFDFVAAEVRPGKENLASAIRIPKGQRHEPESWTPDEIERLVAAAWESASTNLRHLAGYYVLAIALACGLRLQELTGLRFNDVELDRARMSVLGKGNKRRVVALSGDAVGLLGRYLTEVRPKLPASEYVFCNPRSDPDGANHGRWSDRAVEHLFTEFGKLAGLGRSYPHKARHTYASRLHAAGAGTAVIQRQLGHDHLATTEVYLHMLEDDVSEAIERAGSVIAFPDAPSAEAQLPGSPERDTPDLVLEPEPPAPTPEVLAVPPERLLATPTTVNAASSHAARSIAGAVTAALVTRSPAPLNGHEPSAVVEALLEAAASCLAVLENPDGDALAAWAVRTGLVEQQDTGAVTEALTLAAARASGLHLPAARVLARLGPQPVLAAWAAATAVGAAVAGGGAL